MDFNVGRVSVIVNGRQAPTGCASRHVSVGCTEFVPYDLFY